MVNLAPAQRAVEALMTDAGELYRNPGGEDDDVLDPNPTGFTLDPSTMVQVYAGKLTFKLSAAAANGETSSMASLPLEVEADVDDFLRLTETRDPAMDGRWFRVSEVRGGTFAVTRRLVLAEIAAPAWVDDLP